MASLHICIVTTGHPIDDVRVNEKVAQSFIAAGYRVSWVGPNFAFFDDKAPLKSAIEFHLTTRKRRSLDRLLAIFKVYPAARRIPNVDVYYAPEPDSALIAVRLARINHARAIFDIHEVYHGPLLNKWLRGMKAAWFREFVRRRMVALCAKCDLTMGVSDAVLDFYQPPSERRLVARNCAPLWFASEPPSDVCGPSRKTFTLMHGKRTLQRGTIPVLEALSIASKKAPNLRVVMFNHVAAGHDHEYIIFQEEVRKLNLEAVVDLRQGISMKEMPATLRECDAGFIAYGKELGLDSLPNRIFEYMAAGLPVIVPRYAREIVAIVEPEKCGLTVDFEDSEEIAKAILILWKNPGESRLMGKRGRIAFEQRHNWGSEFKKVIERINSWNS